MIAAIYARKSTDQTGVADEQKSVARQVGHARQYAAQGLDRRRVICVRRRRDLRGGVCQPSRIPSADERSETAPNRRYSTITEDIHFLRNTITHVWFSGRGHNRAIDYRMSAGWARIGDTLHINPRVYLDDFLTGYQSALESRGWLNSAGGCARSEIPLPVRLA
jgi:hypothetical protein